MVQIKVGIEFDHHSAGIFCRETVDFFDPLYLTKLDFQWHHEQALGILWRNPFVNDRNHEEGHINLRITLNGDRDPCNRPSEQDHE